MWPTRSGPPSHRACAAAAAPALVVASVGTVVIPNVAYRLIAVYLHRGCPPVIAAAAGGHRMLDIHSIVVFV